MTSGGTLLRKAVESAGGEEAFHRKFRQYEESLSFIEQNKDELLKQFDNNWVAVYRAQVVAHGKNYRNLERKLKEKRLPIEEVVIKFLSSRKILTLY